MPLSNTLSLKSGKMKSFYWNVSKLSSHLFENCVNTLKLKTKISERIPWVNRLKWNTKISERIPRFHLPVQKQVMWT